MFVKSMLQPGDTENRPIEVCMPDLMIHRLSVAFPFDVSYYTLVKTLATVSMLQPGHTENRAIEVCMPD